MKSFAPGSTYVSSTRRLCVFSVVGTSRCDVRAACSGATPSTANVDRAGTAQRATAIEIRFSSSEHDLAYPSLEVIRTGRRKLPPRHLPATPHAHRVVTQPFRQFVEHLLQRPLAGQQFNQAALERVQTHRSIDLGRLRPP